MKQPQRKQTQEEVYGECEGSKEMPGVGECTEKWNGSHAVVVDQLTWADEQPRVDEDEVGPVELAVRGL